MSRSPVAINIRPATAADQLAVSRLAALDSSDELPPMPLLLAEIDRALLVALSLRDGSAVADPFFPTADILALLRAHAAEIGRPPPRPWRRRRPRLSFG